MLASTIWRFPLVYLVMFAVRFIFIAGFSPLFRVLKAKLSMMEIIFATVAGLRGSVSLIMAQAVATDQLARPAIDPDGGVPAVSCTLACCGCMIRASAAPCRLARRQSELWCTCWSEVQSVPVIGSHEQGTAHSCV